MKSTALLLAAAVAICVLGGFVFYQHQALSRAEVDLAGVRAQLGETERKSSELEKAQDQAVAEVASLKGQAAEVHKLRNEVTTLRKEQSTLQNQLKLAAQKGAKNEAAPAPQPAGAENTLPAQFANLEQMTQTVAALRAKAFGGGGLTEQEKQYLQQLKPQIEQLEKSPADFATFQTAMIQQSTGINDQAKLDQIKSIIQKTYEAANTQGLDVTSRRADDPAWVQQRFQLDRRGTGAVQNILSESERAAFDQRFLGVMGVDLGTGVDKSLYPPNFFGQPAPQQ
jgi:hypothetical protein